MILNYAPIYIQIVSSLNDRKIIATKFKTDEYDTDPSLQLSYYRSSAKTTMMTVSKSFSPFTAHFLLNITQY